MTMADMIRMNHNDIESWHPVYIRHNRSIIKRRFVSHGILSNIVTDKKLLKPQQQMM
jgi:hypothetical protein